MAGLLAAAAQAERPEFSQELHQRILRQVARIGVVGGDRTAHWLSSRQRLRVRLALAGCAVAVVLAVLAVTSARHGGFPFRVGPKTEQVANRMSGQTENPPEAVIHGNSREIRLFPDRSLAVIVSTPDRTVQQLQTQLTQLESGRWAGLDRDLLIASEMLKNQLPLNLVAQIRTGEQRTP